MLSEKVEIYSVEKSAVVVVPRVVKTDKEWREQLSDEEYQVMRQSGTERPFSCGFLKIKSNGVYTCVGCGTDLFVADTKFSSGTGWPSFYEPVSEKNIVLVVDKSHGITRTEVRCARCDSHLGHVFPDGPPPSGERFCINGAALKFVENTSRKK